MEVQIENRLEQLSQHLSHYDPESELSAFNNYAVTDWFPVSAELGTVVEYALTVSALSNGAFDISIAPAIDAWGFGPTDIADMPPTEEVLNTVLLHSGYTKLASRESPRAIRKDDPLVRLDLSALAKGYAVDQLAYLLEDQGIHNYLVEIGGETRTAGVRRLDTPWRIGIQPPADGLDLEFVVTPGDAAVATSGDYRNFYMQDDRRISHTIDPSNAQPVANGVMSVSVIAPNAMQADALATALMVLGMVAGAEFAAAQDIAALMIVRTGHGSRAIMSPAFKRYLATD
jgi:thiamine biosynthesis lipoprotein